MHKNMKILSKIIEMLLFKDKVYSIKKKHKKSPWEIVGGYLVYKIKVKIYTKNKRNNFNLKIKGIALLRQL